MTMEDTLKEISLEDKAATSRAMFSEIKWTEKIGNTTLINHEEVTNCCIALVAITVVVLKQCDLL